MDLYNLKNKKLEEIEYIMYLIKQKYKNTV